MGAFFSNLQVKIPAHESLSNRNIIDCIIKIHNDLGYETTENEESADKSIIIASEKSTPWYSIYDEDFDLEANSADILASFLAESLSTTVLSTMVSDSDYLDISLFGMDKTKHSINNVNDELKFTFPEIHSWNSILPDNKSFEDIFSIFREQQILVENYLDKLAPLIHLSPLFMQLGYRYFEEIMPDNGTKLHFAKKEKAQAEALRETNLMFSAYISDYNLKIGEPYSASFLINNNGLPATGMEIIMVGEAIEQEMIVPSDIQIRIDETQKETSFLKTISTDNRKLWVANINDIDIPEGKPLASNHSMKEYREYIKQMYKTAFNLKFQLHGIKQGTTSFSLFAIPLPRGCGQSAYAKIIVTIE